MSESDFLSPLQRKQIRKQGIGLALGAGGLKGFFHIGVLEALEMAEIPVKAIAGSSAGSLAGAMYAHGMSIEEMKEYSVQFSGITALWLGGPHFSSSGILKADKMEDFIKNKIGIRNFSDLKIPLYCVATDLISGKKVVFSEGSVTQALRASISLPIIFSPVIKDGQVLVDGGVKEYVPIKTLKGRWDGLTMGVWLTPPTRHPTDIKLKKNANSIRALVDKIPLVKDWPIFDKPKEDKLQTNMLAIILRSWDILACEKTIIDLQEYPPDIMVQIDPDVNPGMNEMNEQGILSLIDMGKKAALKRLKELRLYND